MEALEHTSKHSACEEAIAAMSVHLESGKMEDGDWKKLQKQFPSCQKEMEEVYALWEAMAKIPTPEPSQGMHARFYHMLNQYEQDLESRKDSFLSNFWNKLGSFGESGRISWAMGIALFLLGVFAGPFLRPGHGSAELRQLSEEVQQMRELTLLTLIKQSSATERLKGIHLTRDIPQPDPSITAALAETLNHDPNVNVRLSALEALSAFAHLPEVRTYLIEAIPHQDSPILQLALAELMLKLQEGNSLEALQELLKSPEIESDVKEHVKETINSLS